MILRLRHSAVGLRDLFIQNRLVRFTVERYCIISIKKNLHEGYIFVIFIFINKCIKKLKTLATPYNRVLRVSIIAT